MPNELNIIDIYLLFISIFDETEWTGETYLTDQYVSNEDTGDSRILS